MTYVPASSIAPVLLSTYSPESLGVQTANGMLGTPAAVSSGTMAASNTALFVPFQLQESVTVLKMFCFNGSGLAGNIDMGIYNSAFARQVSIGPTAQTGASVVQEFDVANTVLAAGRYYLALVSSDGTASYMRLAVTAAAMAAAGCFIEASAGTLPATATPALNTLTSLPIFGLSLRTLVA